MLQWIWECRSLFETLVLFPWNRYPKVKLLENMLLLFLMFWGNPILFSHSCSNVHPHQQWTRVPFYPELHQHFISYLLPIDCSSNRCEVIPHCGFGLYFPFTVPTGHPYVFFAKISFQVLCPFSNQGVCVCVCVCYYTGGEFFIYFR